MLAHIRRFFLHAVAGAIALANFSLMGPEAEAITIAGIAPSRGGRVFSSPDYTNVRAHLLDPLNFGPGGVVPQAVTLAADLTTANAAALAGIDVLISSETGSFSLAEVADIRQFVLDGNCLVLIEDSSSGTASSQILQALDGGNVLPNNGGGNGGAVGSFIAAGASTVGPFGNLVGQTFAATLASQIVPGSSTIIVGQNAGWNALGEVPAGALGVGSGGVLIASDVIFMDFFVPPATLYGNASNAAALMNFISMHAVPEPSSLALVGVIGAFAAAQRRGRRHSV
jgi:hypothetical protein